MKSRQPFCRQKNAVGAKTDALAYDHMHLQLQVPLLGFNLQVPLIAPSVQFPLRLLQTKDGFVDVQFEQLGKFCASLGHVPILCL